MKIVRYALAALLLLSSVAGANSVAPALAAPYRTPTQVATLAAFEQYVARTYVSANLATTGLSIQVLRKALIGYFNLRRTGVATRPILTIIDFNKPSRYNRLWVLDLNQQRLLHHTLVAHGRNTGDDMARSFSNRLGSEMSSLGFYLTGQTYQGKHGLSLKLRGMDPAYNSNIAERAVVVHGADYVSKSFVQQHGRLGRSQGCPALPMDQYQSIIRTIKGGSVVYANAPSTVSYTSNWLDLTSALLAFARWQAPQYMSVGQ